MLINNTSDLVQNIKDRKYHSVVITTHHKPDGDAMGSTLGLCAFLQEFIDDVVVCTPTDYAENLFWLPGNAAVIDFEVNPTLVAEKVASADLVFCLDFNRLSRINQLGELVRESKASKVMIDHHLEPEGFEDFTFWDVRACAAAELVYRKKSGKDPISDDIPSHLKKFVNEEVELDEGKMKDIVTDVEDAMGKIKYKLSQKGGKFIIRVSSNDEKDAQKAMKMNPLYIAGKLRVIPESFLIAATVDRITRSEARDIDPADIDVRATDKDVGTENIFYSIDSGPLMKLDNRQSVDLSEVNRSNSKRLVRLKIIAEDKLGNRSEREAIFYVDGV